MKKAELLKELKDRRVTAYKSWTLKKLTETLEKNKVVGYNPNQDLYYIKL